MIRLTNTVKHLLIINVLVFVGTMAISSNSVLVNNLILYFPENDMFKPWQIVTHMFMHADPYHLLFNMLLLFFFGPAVESYIGRAKFLFLYITAGLGAFLLPLLVDYFQFYAVLNELVSNGFTKESVLSTVKSGMYLPEWENILGHKKLSDFIILVSRKASLGASGAIMGVLASFAVFFPNQKLHLLFPPISIKAKYLIFGMIGADFISAILTGTPLLASSNIGYTAHVGGAITGILITYYWKKNQFNKNRWN